MAKIEFIDVSLKNFMSFGNVEITFNYQKGINVVTGKVENSSSRNGVGKSSMLVDSLSFAIYGKVLRGGKVVLSEIVNKINKKDCVVTARLRVDGELIKVVRSIKPNDLKIYVGESEELKKFDANGRNQEWLEKKIGINHTCFNNIIILNVNSSVPFLDMDAQKKRDVIENILSSAIYGRMANQAKERHLDFKSELREKEVAFQLLNKQYETAKVNLEKNKTVIDSLHEEKEKNLIKLNNELKVLEQKITNIESQITDIQLVDTKTQLQNDIKLKDTTLSDLRSNIKIKQNDINKAKEALSHIENVPHCPTCHTPSDNPYIQKYISELKTQVSGCDEFINDAKKQGATVLKEKEELESKLLKVIDDITKQTSLKDDLRIAKLNLSHKQSEITKEQDRKIQFAGISKEEVDVLESKTVEAQKSLESVAKDFRHYEVVRQILSEDGLRKFVVSRILPILNSKVNEYLKIMGSEYTLAFNMNLEEKILSRNREERPYNSFSSGERKRLDLSVLLALMDISRMQNSVETNLLVLDEVLDTSMDSDGVENFLEFLKTGFKKAYPDKCIYIVTHRKEISGECFDRLINLVKKNNFTEIHSIIDMSHLESV
jgi:DNA repair exonuclease SbcCD ATPase subunit